MRNSEKNIMEKKALKKVNFSDLMLYLCVIVEYIISFYGHEIVGAL